MIPLSSATSSGLSWSKIPRTQNYELRLNEEVVGTLRHLKGWSCDFMGESQEGRWIFRRSGLLGAGTEILDIDSHPIGKFKSAWGGGGLLVFADGQRFHLQCKGLWQPVWTMFAEDNQPVLRLCSRQEEGGTAIGQEFDIHSLVAAGSVHVVPHSASRGGCGSSGHDRLLTVGSDTP